MIDETPLVNAVTLVSDDDIPVVVCYRCGLVAGPDWDEVILGADGRFVCPWLCHRRGQGIVLQLIVQGQPGSLLAGPIFLLGGVPWQIARNCRAGPWSS